jgi:hypothetical protein
LVVHQRSAMREPVPPLQSPDGSLRGLPLERGLLGESVL